MLKKILSKEACAACRFCCVFRRQSLWEVPRLSLDFTEKYPLDTKGEILKYSFKEDEYGRYAITDLRDKYRTDDPEEEAACPFLDTEKGCILPEEDKPFDCKIWPLRYMRLPDGREKVCLTPTCPEIGQVPSEAMNELVRDGLGEQIAAYAKEHPYMLKEYKEGFPVL